jgi:hypothetical protein
MTANIIKTFAVEEWHYALIAFTGVQFMGLSLAFAASYYICQMIKIYTLAVVLPITALIFGCAEIKILREEKMNGNSLPVSL